MGGGGFKGKGVEVTACLPVGRSLCLKQGKSRRGLPKCKLDRLYQRGTGRGTARRLLAVYKQRNFHVFNEKFHHGQTYTIFCKRAMLQQFLKLSMDPKTQRMVAQLHAEEEACAIQLRAPDITPEQRLLYAQMEVCRAGPTELSAVWSQTL